MADDESESREGAAMTQDQFALLMGAFRASQARMEERFSELAEDSGDEKRLKKAEMAAELKTAKRRKKKASSAQSSRSRSLSVPAAAAREPAPPYHIPSSGTRRFTSITAPTPVLRVWRDAPHAHELSEGI